jgi:putative NADPH-quinone reductase
MHCLVVKAHPLSESLCSEIVRRVVDLLETAGHAVVLEDLYAGRFNPVMTPVERSSYYAGPYEALAVEKQVEHLLWAEAMVLVFPTWWFTYPAILSGWFDRVWGPGVAYDHADDYGPIKARLNNLSQMLAITALGSPWWVDRVVMRQPVRRVLKTAVLGACAPKCRFDMLSLYKSESLTPAKVDQFWGRIRKVISKWQ